MSYTFTKVPDWLLEADISLGAFKMYVVLASYTSAGDNTARPSLTTLSKRLGVSRPTVNKWKQELDDFGAITVNNRYHENSTGQKSNEYVIHFDKPVKKSKPKSTEKPATKTTEKHAPSKASFTTSEGDDEDRPSKASFTTLVKPALPPWLSQLYTELEPMNKNHRTRSYAADAATPEEANGVTEQPALDGLDVEPVEAEIVDTDEQPETEPDVEDKPNAQTLIAEWLDHRETRPPGRVIGHLSKEIKNLLDEGFDYELVRAAVGQWHQRNLHPSVLPSVLDGIQNGQNRPVGGTAAERRLLAGQARDRALAANTAPSMPPVDPFALEAQQIQQTKPRQIGNGAA